MRKKWATYEGGDRKMCSFLLVQDSRGLHSAQEGNEHIIPLS